MQPHDNTKSFRKIWANQAAKKMDKITMSNNIHQVLIVDDGVELDTEDRTASVDRYFLGYYHYIWDKESIRAFMKQNKDLHVLKAFDSLNVYSFKADLAKYYICYKLGGWVSDINNEFIMSPPKLGDNELIIFRDRQMQTGTSWAVVAGLFYANKEHPVMLQAVNDIVENCKNKYYGRNPLCPTGPILFGAAIAKVGLNEGSTYSIGDFVDMDPKLFKLQNGLILANYKRFSAGDVGHAGTNNYNDMWKSKSVYK